MLIHHPQLKKLIAVERETSIKHSNSYRLRTVGFGYIYIYIYIYTYTHIYIYIYVCEFFTQISDRLKLSSDLCIRVFLLTHTLSHSLTQKTTTSYNVVFRVLVSLRLCVVCVCSWEDAYIRSQNFMSCPYTRAETIWNGQGVRKKRNRYIHIYVHIYIYDDY